MSVYASAISTDNEVKPCEFAILSSQASLGGTLTFVTDGPDWMIKTLSELEQVANLPDGWDGYGSPAVLDEVKRNASTFLRCLEIEDIPVAYVGPISGGGVQLEWHCNGRELEVEFTEKDSIGYLKVFQDGSMHEGEFHNLDEARQIIRWLKLGK